MYTEVETPQDLEKPLHHQCKYCHRPDATHQVDYPIMAACTDDGPPARWLYTFAAFCDDCGGLTVVAIKGNFPGLEQVFSAAREG